MTSIASTEPGGEARTYGGETGTERVARRREQLIDAAFELIAEHGSGRLNIEVICRHAGLGKRYFYESFADLDAITGAVIDGVATGMIGAMEAVFDPDRPLGDLTRATIEALVAHVSEDPRRARVLFGEAAGSEAAAAYRETAGRRITDIVAARGRTLHRARDNDDPIVHLSATYIVGGTGQALLAWVDGESPLTREQFVENLAGLWLVTGEGMTERVRKARRGSRQTR